MDEKGNKNALVYAKTAGAFANNTWIYAYNGKQNTKSNEDVDGAGWGSGGGAVAWG